MKAANKFLQGALMYLLTVAIFTTSVAAGCTFTFSSRDDEQTTRFQTNTGSRATIIQDGRQVHP